MSTILQTLFDNKPKALLIAVNIAAISSIVYYYTHTGKKTNTIPGPSGWPIVGDTDFYSYLFKFKAFEYHEKNINKYGPIFQTDGLAGNMVMVADAQEAKRILTDTDTFIKGDELRSKMIGLLDNALFLLPSGDLWKKHRMQSVQSLNGKSNGSWDDLDAITSDVFAFRFGTHPWLYKLLGVHLTSPKVAKAKQEIYKFLDELADERLEKIRTKEVSQEKWDMDVLHRLLISLDKGILSKDEVYGELIGFFFAGHETTANSLTFLFMELSKNPEIREKLYQEVKDVDFESENLSESISKIKYLDNCLKEAMRLHSAVPNVLRTAAVDTTVGGYPIKKGQQIILNFRGIHLSEKNYHNAREYNPDRWNQQAESKVFLPFGDGPHMCIGQKLAVIEAKIIIVRLVQKFYFDIVPDHPLDAVLSITYGLKHGLLVNVKERI